VDRTFAQVDSGHLQFGIGLRRNCCNDTAFREMSSYGLGVAFLPNQMYDFAEFHAPTNKSGA
jgi:hypothetical protein